MWFKKKSVLLAEHHYDTEKSVDGSDWRTTTNDGTWPVSNILPSAADINNYFYLPALGYYPNGNMFNVGRRGGYWSSSAAPSGNSKAYILDFFRGFIYVGIYDCRCGYRAEALFE